MNRKSQIQIGVLIGALITVLVASGGFMVNKFIRQDDAITKVEAIRASSDNEQNQRLATVETNFKNLKENVDIIREDIKDIKTYFGIKPKR